MLVRYILKKWKIAKWPKVDAEILKVIIQKDDFRTPRVDGVGGGNMPQFIIYLDLKFYVYGEVYLENKYLIHFSTFKEARKARSKIGEVIEIRYNPENPKETEYDARVTLEEVVYIVLGLIGLGFLNFSF